MHLVQSEKNSMMSWPDIKLIPQTNKLAYLDDNMEEPLSKGVPVSGVVLFTTGPLVVEVISMIARVVVVVVVVVAVVVVIVVVAVVGMDVDVVDDLGVVVVGVDIEMSFEVLLVDVTMLDAVYIRTLKR